MTRQILQTPAFRRDLKSRLKSHPGSTARIFKILELLANDPATSSLHSHKLKGNLAGSWSCSAGYDLRIIYDFATHDGVEVIVVHALGSHDDVY